MDYGSSSNIRTASNLRTPTRIADAPRIEASRDLSRDIFREDRTRRNRSYRHGYYHYNPFWMDNYFHYPYYYFSYLPGGCVLSPFYYYHHLPGYISYSRIRVGIFNFILIHDHHYDWRRPRYTNYLSWQGYGGYGRNQRDYRDSRYTELDYAIDDIVSSFERGSMRAMQYLVPTRGEVYIELEDYTQYRMQARDFYDMMADMVETTDTTRYTIQDVQYDGDQVVIYAEHEYRDPWGRRERKYHTFGLAETRSGYVIEYFRVDRARSW